MKALFSADWQCSYENIDLCKRAAEEILQIRESTEFEVLVLCGDLKQIYNPCDIRVINFWQRTIKKWIKNGMQVVVNLGNHDRLGMHSEKPNWLPVLRNVGAKAYDQPTYHELRDGYRLGILPFRQNPLLIKREAYEVAASARAGRDVLVFHADIKTAKYNVLSYSASETGLDVKDLYPQKYMYCIGGHLHLQQRVRENVYYAGSPFATDWGEANQRKGYLLLNFETKKITRIQSKIPGWYDPSWPKFEEVKPDSWEGTHVRIKVPCEGNANIAERLRRESEIAKRTYPGARLSVIPEFASGGKPEDVRIRAAQPDDKKIRIYLKESLPASLRRAEDKIYQYLLEHLGQVGGIQREGGELKFISAHGKNFLSYKELSVEFNEGLTVVSGKNKDWLDRSNGSGKTSYLQMIAVALFGQTFKGQKHDRWMRRGTAKGDKSFISVLFRDSQDRLCIVRRSRQPKKLKLMVEGEVVEAGNRPEATQGLIEQITGYTWETLANAVYVDQGSTHLMLTGTEAQRKGFLAKLQNLERFERAEMRIRGHKTDVERKYEIVSAEISGVAETIKSLREAKESARAILDTSEDVQSKYEQAEAAYLKKKIELDKWERYAAEKLKMIGELRRIQEEAKYKLVAEYGKAFARRAEYMQKIQRIQKIKGECPTCFQPLNAAHSKKHLVEWTHSVKHYDLMLAGYDKQLEHAKNLLGEFASATDAWQRNQPLACEVSDARDGMNRAKEALKQYQREKDLLAGLQKKIIMHSARKESLEEKRGKISKRLELIKFAQSVFQRNGLPAFLNAQVCPELNQAAQEYSELFAQSEIQVRFAIDDDGRMDVQVVNAHGGEGLEDQSEGEMKLASLITAFAVRSLAPKTNILILDEPGDGLDAISARNFAKGLREISKKFCIIHLSSHNPAILSELADSKVIEIVKHNKVSRVVQ